MNKIHLYLICMVSVTTGYSQTIEKKVIASAGKEFKNSSCQMSWTLGEPVIQTLSTESVSLNQGFHQGSLKITSVFTSESNVQISVYPNPAVHKVFISLNKVHQKTAFEIYNLHGEQMKKGTLENIRTEVDVSSMPDGTYILNILNSNRLARSYRLVKMY